MHGILSTRSTGAYLVGLMLAIAVSARLNAETVTVGFDPMVCDYTNLQEAVDQAADGDVLMLQAGTYTETGGCVLDFKGKRLWIESVDGAEKTILDGEGIGRVVKCLNVIGDNTFPIGAMLIGVTIQNGTNVSGLGEGGGMYVEASTFWALKCIFKTNHGAKGGAVYLRDSTAYFTYCLFRSNTANVKGGAIAVDNTYLKIKGSSFRYNSSVDGGAIYAWASAYLTLIEHTLFCKNSPNDHVGTPIYPDPDNTDYFDNCPSAGLIFHFDEQKVISIFNWGTVNSVFTESSDFSFGNEISDASAVAAMPDGNIAIADNESGLLHVYNPNTNSYGGVLYANDLLQQAVAIAFDGGLGYVADATGIIHVFDVASGIQLALLPSEFPGPLYLEIGDDSILWVGSANSAAPVQGWHAPTGQLVYDFGGEIPNLQAPGEISMLPDGSLLVVDRTDGEILRLDPTTGAVSLFLSAEEARDLSLGTIASIEWICDDYIYVLSNRGLSRFTQDGVFIDDIEDSTELLASADAFIPFSPTPPISVPGDINRDGSVDGVDLALLLGAWGSDDASSDLNGDGIVNGSDLAIVLGNWESN